jgi:hypothetical protein
VMAAAREAAQSLRAPVMNNPSMFLCPKGSRDIDFLSNDQCLPSCFRFAL